MSESVNKSVGFFLPAIKTLLPLMCWIETHEEQFHGQHVLYSYKKQHNRFVATRMLKP